MGLYEFITGVQLPEISTPSGTPDSGTAFLYFKVGGKLYRKNDNGVEAEIAGVERTNYVLVQEKAALPAPVSGVITLAADTIYEINGAIALGTDRIVVSDGTVIVGGNPFHDSITYTGTGDMFTGVDAGCEISNMRITCANGRMLNISATGGNKKEKIFLFNRCAIPECDKIGIVEGYKVVTINRCTFDLINTDGVESTGSDNGDFIFFDTIVKQIDAGQLFRLGTSVWDIWQADRNELNIQGTGNPIGISGLDDNGNINIKGLVTNNRWIGDGEYIDDTHANDIREGGTKWDFQGNTRLPDITDTTSNGLISVEDNATSIELTTQNTWYLIDSTSILLESVRFDMPQNGRLRYTGLNDITVSISVALTCIASSGNEIEFTVFKNGVIVPDAKKRAQTDSNKAAPAVLMSENDYLEVYARDVDSDSTDLTVINMQLRVNR